jgi:hypothetical protein
MCVEAMTSEADVVGKIVCSIRPADGAVFTENGTLLPRFEL